MSSISGRQFTKNTMWNLIGQGAPLFAALFSIPILIEWLGNQRFGLLTLVWVLVGYFSIFDFGLGRAVTHLVSTYRGQNELERNYSTVSTALIIMLFIGFLGGLLLYFAAPFVTEFFLKVTDDFKNEAYNTILVLCVSLPVIVTTSCLNGVLEGFQKFSTVNSLRFFLGLWTYLMPLIFRNEAPNLTKVATILMLGRILIWIISFVMVTKTLQGFFAKFRFNREEVKPLFSFGGWMTVSNFISPLMVYSDRFLLGATISMSLVAYYTTPFEAMSRLLILGTAFGGAIFPAVAKDFSRHPELVRGLVHKSTKVLILLILPILLLVFTLAPWGLGVWLNAEFSVQSTPIVRILCLGIFFNILAQIPFAVIQGANLPQWTARVHLIELPFYAVVLWFSLKTFGVLGAAIAWSLRVSVDSIVLFILSEKILRAKA